MGYGNNSNEIIQIDNKQLEDEVSANTNKIGLLSDLKTTEKSSLVNAVNENVSQLADIAIDVCNPQISGLTSVKADGSDILGDTNRLQSIINFALSNNRDVYIPKNLILEPIQQADGSLVCIIFDDGLASTGNDRKSIRIYCKKGVVISTNNNTSPHTIFRWKLGDSILENMLFKGDRTYTTGLEISRINLKDGTEADASTRNRFSNIRFYTCNLGLSMEGSAYYNTFDNITFYSCNKCLWLKPTYALINGINTNDSGVNRNNFYSVSAFECTDGIILDFGDTNKFYSSSFEGLTGTAIAVNEMTATYPNVQQTIYNTFYGVTNENNNMNLILNSQWGNSFIDVESPFTKVQFNHPPLVYIPSGDNAQNHMVLQTLFLMNDRDDMGYGKNKTHSIHDLYVTNISDNVGTGSDGNVKGYGWRNFNFTTAQCTNVSTLQFNSQTKQAIFKSIGGIVFYYAKFGMNATSPTSAIKIPLPELTEDNDIFGFGNNVPSAVSIGYTKDAGAPQLLPAIIDTDHTLNIQPPTGGWSTNTTASANVFLINIHYVRTFGAFVDLN